MPASTSSTPPTSTRSASPRRSSARRWRRRSATAWCWRPRCTGRWASDPNAQGNSRRWIMDRVRQQPAPPRRRLHRPLPDPPAVARDRHRRDARRAHRSRAGREDPLLRQLDVPGARGGRGAVGGRAPGPRALRHRAAAVFDSGAQHREGRAADVPALRHGRAVVEPAGGRLALGRLRDRQGEHEPAGLGHARPLQHGAPRQPGQARGGRPARHAGGRGGAVAAFSWPSASCSRTRA